MKILSIAVPVALVATLVAPPAFAGADAATAQAGALPKVVILATGGTIAGVQPKEGEPGYKAGSLSVSKRAVTKVAGVVAKTVTTKVAGKYKVTVTTPAGLAKATGKVTVMLTKGTVKKKVAGTLSNGVVTITVPKSGKGTWKVSIAYPGDTRYSAKTAAGTSVVVRR